MKRMLGIIVILGCIAIFIRTKTSKHQPKGWVESATVTVPGPPKSGFKGQPFPDSTRYYPNNLNGFPMHPIYIFLDGHWQYDWEQTEKEYPGVFNKEKYPPHPGGTTIKLQ